LMIDYLPMLPIQILLVNLLSDFPMISIATDNVEKDEIRKPCVYNNTEIVIIATFLGIVSTVFDLLLFSIFRTDRPEVLRTAWFIESILTELILIYSIRTRSFIIKSRSKPSGIILFLTLLAGVSTFVVTFLPFGKSVFGFTPLSYRNLITILVVSIGYFITSEIVKLSVYKNKMKNSQQT